MRALLAHTQAPRKGRGATWQQGGVCTRGRELSPGRPSAHAGALPCAEHLQGTPTPWAWAGTLCSGHAVQPLVPATSFKEEDRETGRRVTWPGRVGL